VTVIVTDKYNLYLVSIFFSNFQLWVQLLTTYTTAIICIIVLRFYVHLHAVIKVAMSGVLWHVFRELGKEVFLRRRNLYIWRANEKCVRPNTDLKSKNIPINFEEYSGGVRAYINYTRIVSWFAVVSSMSIDGPYIIIIM